MIPRTGRLRSRIQRIRERDRPARRCGDGRRRVMAQPLLEPGNATRPRMARPRRRVGDRRGVRRPSESATGDDDRGDRDLGGEHRAAVGRSRRRRRARHLRRARWRRARSRSGGDIPVREEENARHEPGLSRPRSFRAGVEREARRGGAAGGRRVPTALGRGLPSTADLLRGALPNREGRHTHRAARRAVSSRAARDAQARRLGVGGQPLHRDTPLSRPSRPQHDRQQLGLEDRAEPDPRPRRRA